MSERIQIPFTVYLIKSNKGLGYKVATFNEEKKEHKVVSEYLPLIPAERISQGFFRAGYKLRGIIHEVDNE